MVSAATTLAAPDIDMSAALLKAARALLPELQRGQQTDPAILREAMEDAFRHLKQLVNEGILTKLAGGLGVRSSKFRTAAKSPLLPFPIKTSSKNLRLTGNTPLDRLGPPR